jgi:GT2 family glycosyltransferase
VLHDLNHAARYAHHLVALRDGKIVAAGPPGEIVDEALYPMGCGMAVRRAAVDRVGTFDDRMLNYYDDVDYGTRLWRAGYRVTVAADAWIDHGKTKTGYEIPFTRHFYVYTPPRPLAEIDAELRDLEAQIQALLGDMTA